MSGPCALSATARAKAEARRAGEAVAEREGLIRSAQGSPQSQRLCPYPTLISASRLSWRYAPRSILRCKMAESLVFYHEPRWRK